MNRAISNYSDSSSIDEETLLQQELARLQRQYRTMENERKAKTMESELTIKSQQKTIKQLEKELSEILTEMKLASSAKNKKKDGANAAVLKQFMDDQNDCTKLIQKENQEIQELDKKISEIEEKINEQHRLMGGVKNSHTRHVKTQHTVRVLENRLNKCTREFNEMLAENAKLREKIQHLRSQRAVLDTVHKRLNKDLVGKKRKQLELIEQSTMAFDQRDEAEQKMTTLQDRNQKDLAQFNMEYKELMRQLDHDTALKKFLLDKAQERWELAEGQANEREKCFEEKLERQAEKTLREYLNAFKKIKTITGENENEKLVERFIEMEDQNFAMFNYVNEINNKLEIENDKIRAMENEIKIHEADAEESLAAKRSEFEQIKAQYEQKLKIETETMNRMKQQELILAELREGTEKIFLNTECSRDQIEGKLGDQTSVTNQNMMEYLAAIEDKANEMIKKHIVSSCSDELLAYATDHKDNDDAGDPPMPDEVVQHNAAEDAAIILDVAAIRSRAITNIKTKEAERNLMTADKPQIPVKENKITKNRNKK